MYHIRHGNYCDRTITGTRMLVDGFDHEVLPLIRRKLNLFLGHSIFYHLKQIVEKPKIV